MYSCLNYATTVFTHWKPPPSPSNGTLQCVPPALGSQLHHLGQAPSALSICCRWFAETHQLLLYHLLRTLFSTSKSTPVLAGHQLCTQTNLKAARQPTTVGFRQEIVFHVLSDLGVVGRERKHGNCHNRAGSNFDISRRRTKRDLSQFWCQIKQRPGLPETASPWVFVLFLVQIPSDNFYKTQTTTL